MTTEYFHKDKDKKMGFIRYVKIVVEVNQKKLITHQKDLSNVQSARIYYPQRQSIFIEISITKSMV